ncbi:dUTP diphosphatase [Candidatus Pacearchaeota archaeon]|nr:dUTP diphosphatase [Candidatus Pacearchaeota archaeon]
MKIQIKKISEDAIIPKYVHEGDSGFDFYSIEDHKLAPGKRILVKTGLQMSIPLGYELQIRPKSGLALKNGITILNTPGTIDAGYRGEIGIILINLSEEEYSIEKGKKIAQGVVCRVENPEIEEVDELSETSRGEGGFGSTGLH